MNPLKPWSKISSEEWYNSLTEKGKETVQNQYLERKSVMDSFQHRIFATKNRAPTEKEWKQFKEMNYTPMGISTIEEEGLKTGEILEVAMPSAKVLKGAAVVAGGVGALATNMAIRKGRTKAPLIAKGQAGWIGSAKSTNNPTMKDKLQFALDLKQKGADSKTIWEETGVFDFGAGARYFDLSVIDDYVKNTGKLVSDKGFVSLKGQVGDQYPSLMKHIPPEVQQKYLVMKDKNLASAGLHDPNSQRMFYNPNKVTAEGVLPHEIQHAIQQTQKLPSRGYNTADAKELVEQSPKLLAKIKEQNRKFLDQAAVSSRTGTITENAIGRERVAYDVYRHNIGEAEATINQVYHNFIRNEVLKGTPPEKIKAIVQKQSPYKLLEQRYTTKKLWKEGDVKIASSEAETKSTKRILKEAERKAKELKNQELGLKVNLSKEDLLKTPEVLKEQGF